MSGSTLIISNPCPVALARMKKDGDCFSCKSCNTRVIDFRKMGDDEIRRILKPGDCGIFDADQVARPQNTSPLRKIFFYSLTVLSILGFQVKPLAAQEPKKAEVKVESTTELKQAYCPKPSSRTEKYTVVKDIPQQKIRKRKRKKMVAIGCPAF